MQNARQNLLAFSQKEMRESHAKTRAPRILPRIFKNTALKSPVQKKRQHGGFGFRWAESWLAGWSEHGLGGQGRRWRGSPGARARVWVGARQMQARRRGRAGKC